MKRYIVITRFLMQDFTPRCEEALAEGWQPVGGVCVTFTDKHPSGTIWAQAFIKNEQ